nr:AEC family transporter [bacterium]
MSPVAVQVLALTFLLACGALLRRIRQMDDKLMQGLNNLVLNVALPAMVINAFQISASGELMRELGLALLLAAAAHVVMLGLGWLFTFKLPRDRRMPVWFGAVFSNAGFIGFPVVQAAFPDNQELALLYATMYVVMFHIFSWTAGRKMFDRSQSGIKNTLKGLVNPTLVAVAVGATLFLCGISLPDWLLSPIRSLGSLTTPLSMLVIGARLGATPVKELFKGWDLYVAVLLRQLLCPALVMGLFMLIGYHGLPMKVLLLESAMPAAAFLAMFAERWEGNKPLASRIVALSSLLAAVSVPLWLYLANLI